MSRDVHAGEHLKDLLVGQILWVSNTQLIATALLTAALLALWKTLRQRLGDFGFYALFAVAITASVQLVGIYLVFASLIVPALATHRCTKRRYLFAFAVGIAGYLSGLLLSVWFDLPTGAAIVWAMALAGALLLMSAPARKAD
jgi:zinc/manganese transport system permease protein